MTEKIAGTETGTQCGKQYKRGRASSAIEMDEASSVLKELNWFWNIPKNLSLKDGMTDRCVEKLGEAVDAHNKLFKSAVDIKKNSLMQRVHSLLYTHSLVSNMSAYTCDHAVYIHLWISGCPLRVSTCG